LIRALVRYHAMPKLRDHNIWFQNALTVTEDPATSYWLKNALIEAINRDPVDAAQDAEVLSRILKLRAAAAVQKEPEMSGTKAVAPKTVARIEP
jgi:hypothetical protein